MHKLDVIEQLFQVFLLVQTIGVLRVSIDRDLFALFPVAQRVGCYAKKLCGVLNGQVVSDFVHRCILSCVNISIPNVPNHSIFRCYRHYFRFSENIGDRKIGNVCPVYNSLCSFAFFMSVSTCDLVRPVFSTICSMVLPLVLIVATFAISSSSAVPEIFQQ